jgi:2-oxoglutarate ferredoxin oxidoreductase subunit delta
MGKTLKAEESVKTAAADTDSTEKKPTATKKRKTRGRVTIDEEACKGCGLCISFCPSHVLDWSDAFNKKGYHPPVAARPEACIGCDLCGRFCPDFAIFGQRITNHRTKEKKS